MDQYLLWRHKDSSYTTVITSVALIIMDRGDKKETVSQAQ